MNKKNSSSLMCLIFAGNAINLKRLIVLLLTLFVLQINVSVNAQQTRISLNLKQSKIKQALKEIEKLSDYTFFYNDAEIDTERKVDIQFDNEPVDVILSTILPNVSYAVDKKKIILTPKKSQAETSAVNSPQTKTIKGTITDESGLPIIGASIQVTGTSIGTMTDMDGNYTLNVPENGQLTIAYVGYVKQSVALKGKKEIDIVLVEDSKLLDEVVVVGYGVQKKANLSGAVESVSTKALTNRSVSNMGQALQGVVSNLNITTNGGQANSNPTLNIRGTTSIVKDANTSPLVVIDGVASSTQDLYNMNPSDIENISVMKDASSAAIYGSRAAFGVILVTTKKGTGEKVSVNYNNNFSFRSITRMPEVVTDPATVVDMKNIYGYPWYTLYDENGINYAKQRSQDPSVSPYMLKPDGTWEYFGTTDWYAEAYKNSGFSTNHSIDISGASKLLSYYFSANYFFQDGMLRYGNDKYNRYNLRSKLDFTVTDWWHIGNNTSYMTADYDQPTYLGSDFYWAVARTNTLVTPKNPDGSWSSAGASLLGRLNEGGRRSNLNSTFSTQFTTKVDLIKNILSLNGSFALSRNEYSDERASLPTGYKTGPDLAPKYYNEISSARDESSHIDNITFDVYSSFNKTFAEKHFVSAVLGFNQEEYRYKQTVASRSELISSSLPTIQLATGEMSMSASKSAYALRGAFYRLNYVFADKYIFETNGRYDGTSRFPKDDRFAFNPSASIGWVVSKEQFFEPLTDIISHLKLRASYGNLGNQAASSYYPYIASMKAGKTSAILDGTQPIYVGAPGLVSNSLTWEKVTTSNFGIDLNLLNNRIALSTDIYQRDTKDMLTKGKTLPKVLGASEPQENAADLRTTGWEITASWKDQIKLAGKPFSYNLNFILYDSKSKITKFDNPTGNLDDYYVGWQIGDIWGFKTLGFFTSEEDIKNHADQTSVTAYPGTFPLAPGDLKFEDRNNDGKVDWGKWTKDDSGDAYIIGNDRPRYNFSFTGGFEWNSFDFSFFLQGVGKKDYYPNQSDLFFWGIQAQPWTNVTKGNMDYWTENNPNAYFPRRKAYVAYESWKECAAPQTKYLQNAAYVRLKNLTVGYTLPKAITQKANISRLRVYFTGENLGVISGLHKYYKVDPEGLGGQMYPLQRSFAFGLNVSF